MTITRITLPCTTITHPEICSKTPPTLSNSINHPLNPKTTVSLSKRKRV